MKSILVASTAIALAMGISHANASMAPALAVAASTVASNVTTSSLNKSQLSSINKAGGGGGGGGGGGATVNDSSQNNTKVDGSLGLGFGFPSPAIGNDSQGAAAVGWGAFTWTWVEDELVNRDIVINAVSGYAFADTPEKAATFEVIVGGYMCASESPNVRGAGGVLMAKAGWGGCPAAQE